MGKISVLPVLVPGTAATLNQSQQFVPLFLSRRDAAKALAISPRSLDYLIADGRLSTRRIGGRVLVPVDALCAFAKCDHRSLIVAA
ncbi:hypothetical protein SAMN05443244_0344 [Terriglobus roseus]|uniref:Helix-turn-helix domain-containing protein n=1 Tax=Terriglobus roseus TaxID=392734 RepID=A0A1H4J5P8_9BACT|nr:hypothetical protein SAMN05443244_0344 [Terriglobus roseus]